jgi:hypothetical protein
MQSSETNRPLRAELAAFLRHGLFKEEQLDLLECLPEGPQRAALADLWNWHVLSDDELIALFEALDEEYRLLLVDDLADNLEG